jgi:WD40 repeat protein
MQSGDRTVTAIGSRDGTIRVGPLDGSPLHLLVGHEGPIVTLAISPDLRWVASPTWRWPTSGWPREGVRRSPLPEPRMRSSWAPLVSRVDGPGGGC